MYTLPEGYPNDDKVLQSTNAGILSWVDKGSSGVGAAGNSTGEIQYYSGGNFAASSGLKFVSGALICTGNITAYSDIRLKHNITTISEPNEKLKKINGYEFDWKEKNNKKHDIGVIAQEIEKVIPEVVIESDGYKSVDYGRIVALLIESNKDLF